MATIAVFGIGYVGCVTAACLCRDGHRVFGVDIDPRKVSELNSGCVPVVEPGLAELVAEQVDAGRLTATTSVDDAVNSSDMALIAVGTPSNDDGSVSTASVERVFQKIGETLRGSERRYSLVVRSTLLPGIIEHRLIPLLEAESGRTIGDTLSVCSNPEFLREGHAIRDYENPPFIVVGSTDPVAARAVLDLYQRLPGPRFATDMRTAALVKYASNAYHALKVAFGNEIGTLAKAMGADGLEVMNIVCQDRKLNISPAYLRPGFAFGGSCLPKDLRAAIRYVEQQGLHLGLLRSILQSNDAHIERGIRLIERSGHRKIGQVGLSFKAGTDDLRESPLVRVVEILLGRGYDIRIYDPHVTLSRLRGRNLAYVDRHLPHLAALVVDSAQELYDHASLLVLGTDVADDLDVSSHFMGHVLDLRRDLIQPIDSCGAVPETQLIS